MPGIWDQLKYLTVVEFVCDFVVDETTTIKLGTEALVIFKEKKKDKDVVYICAVTVDKEKFHIPKERFDELFRICKKKIKIIM